MAGASRSWKLQKGGVPFLPRAILADAMKRTAVRLMLVDDSAHARHGMAALLSTHPEIDIVGEASNGQEAVAAMETIHPDVIIMDVQMPTMNGLDATRLIKNRWPDVKVIMLTIYSNFQEEARSAGADAFLMKGCPADELLSLVTGRKGK